MLGEVGEVLVVEGCQRDVVYETTPRRSTCHSPAADDLELSMGLHRAAINRPYPSDGQGHSRPVRDHKGARDHARPRAVGATSKLIDNDLASTA